MRNLILLLIALLGAIYIYLVLAVEDDKRWFKEFSRNSKSKPNTFDEFIFSESTLYENYSMKFTKSDTVFMEVRFPKPVKQYFAILTDTMRRKLNFILDTLNLVSFDTSYIQENLQDGLFMKFHLHSNKTVKNINIYGNEAPPSIYPFAEWLYSLANSLTKYPMIKQIDFGDLSGVNPPPSPPPPRLRN